MQIIADFWLTRIMSYRFVGQNNSSDKIELDFISFSAFSDLIRFYNWWT